MINKVVLIGNLGRDPEVRRLESGVAVAKFPIATNENYKDKSGEWQSMTEWHDVVAWRGLAERVERDLKKGKLAYVEGKLTHRKFQDKDGNDRYITEVVANVVRVLERREASGGTYGSNFPTEMNAPSMSPATGNNSAASTETTVASTPTAADDDLPF
ncbi:MAG: single-stranded DNA-binding protein [Bacteroidota bacterium]